MADADAALLQLGGVYTDIGRYQILYGVDLAVPAGSVSMGGRSAAWKRPTLPAWGLPTCRRIWAYSAG
jgi:hypothetical protein